MNETKKTEKQIEDEMFAEEECVETKNTHTLEGLTNELEDITDEQVADIKVELISKIPTDRCVDERSLNLDARRVFANMTTVDKVIAMYTDSICWKIK